MKDKLIIGCIILLFLGVGILSHEIYKTEQHIDKVQKQNMELRKEIKNMKETVKSFKSTVDGQKSESRVRIFDDVNAGEFKAYMDYRTITDTSSEQWALQQKAYTGPYGIRKVDGYFCVAMGSKFGTEIGQKFTLEMANGKKIPVILADQKADADTDPTHMYDKLGGIVEFVVEKESLSSLVKTMGDISYADYEFYGPIKNIVTEPYEVIKEVNYDRI